MKKPMFFHAIPDCGCGSSSSYSASSGSACQSTVICDDRYYSLVEVPRLKLLGVVPGSSCQTFLNKLRGFLVDDASGLGAYITKQPLWDLPLINPISSGAYPVPSGGFPFLVAATGDSDNTPWKFLRAPSSGAYLLQVENGGFVLKDAGTIPGVNAVCSQQSYASMVFLSGCAPTGSLDDNGDPIYAMKKLLAVQDRVVVGFTNEDNTVGFKSLASNSPLLHPTIKPNELNTRTYVQRDTDDDDYDGGIQVLPLTGDGAPGDAVQGYYSPTTHKFYRAPAHTRVQIRSVTDQAVTAGSEYQAVTGHLSFGSQTINYPTVEVYFCAQFNAQEDVAYALYMDGNQVHEWKYNKTNGAKQAIVSGSCILTNVSVVSAHTFEIRVKLTGTDGVLEYTDATLKTLA